MLLLTNKKTDICHQVSGGLFHRNDSVLELQSAGVTTIFLCTTAEIGLSTAKLLKKKHKAKHNLTNKQRHKKKSHLLTL